MVVSGAGWVVGVKSIVPATLVVSVSIVLIILGTLTDQLLLR